MTLILLSRCETRLLSIQYVYERVSFLFRLSLKAGAKVENLFLTGKCFLKFFFKEIFVSFSTSYLPIYQWTFRVLRGANVTSVFKSHKLFLNYFSKLSFLLIRLTCQYFCERLSLLRVQKYHLYWVLQAFNQTIFDLFLNFFLTAW